MCISFIPSVDVENTDLLPSSVGFDNTVLPFSVWVGQYFGA
jgi:hypothetical protein